MEKTTIKQSEFRALVRECIKEVLVEIAQAKKSKIKEASKTAESKEVVKK